MRRFERIFGSEFIWDTYLGHRINHEAVAQKGIKQTKKQDGMKMKKEVKKIKLGGVQKASYLKKGETGKRAENKMNDETHGTVWSCIFHQSVTQTN